MMVSSRLIELGPCNARLARIRLATVALSLLAFAAVARAGRTPAVPANLQVPAGQVVAFHAYAAGVQIYVCKPSLTDPTKLVWTFKAPEATLYDADGNVVGLHYVGPTWESTSGSKVVGMVLQKSPSPDPNAIPWLLLKAVSNEGPGVFARVAYIQRIKTAAGKAPIDGCDEVNTGVEVRVPYTAEYYFYRAQP